MGSRIRQRFLPLLGAAVLLAPSLAEAHGGPPEGRGRGICDASELQEALDSARSGEQVRIGACTVRGSFRVPAGVTLRGVSRWVSGLDAPADGVAVTLEAAAEPAQLSSVGVQADGLAGIVVDGAGGARIERTVVYVSRGIGIGAEDVGSLTVERTIVQGPITRDSTDTVSPHVVPSETGTHGIVLLDVADADLERVHTHAFASFGAFFGGGHTEWRGGTAYGNVNTGVFVYGGEATLEHVRIARTYRGRRPAWDQPAGLVFARGAEGRTEHVEVARTEGWGAFHHGNGVVEHSHLVATANDLSGVWMQQGEYLQIDDSHLVANDYAGAVAIRSTMLSIRDSNVFYTNRTDPSALEPAGDGVQTHGTFLDIASTNLMLNDRVGVLSKVLGISPCLHPREHVTAERVRVLGFGDALGALLQHDGRKEHTFPIEDGVRRLGEVGSNDEAFVEEPVDLGVAEGISPCLLPVADGLVEAGLDSILDGGDQLPGEPIDFPSGP